MQRKTYTLTFKDYAPKLPNTPSPIEPQLIFFHFKLCIQNMPENYKTFAILLISDLPYRISEITFTPPSKFTIHGRNTNNANSNIVFKNAAQYFSFIGHELSISHPQFSDYLNSLSFEAECLNDLYNRYCSYVSKFQKKNPLFTNYVNDVNKYYPTSHFLYKVFLEYNNAFLCIDKNIAFKDGSKLNFSMHSLDPTINSKKIRLFNKIPQLLSYENFHTSAPCCTSNYSFNFNYEGKTYHAYYWESSIKYETVKNPYVTLQFCIDLKSSKNLQLSDTALSLLYNLSGGHRKDLDTLAILCAILSTNYYTNTTYTLPSKNCSPLQLYTIFSSQSGLASISAFICSLYFGGDQTNIYKLKELTKKETFCDLITFNLAGILALLTVPSSTKESDTQIKMIKQIIRRKPISFKSRIGQDATLLNHLPIVCFTSSQNELNYLNANYNTKVFHFNHVLSNAIEPISISIADAKILITFLCIYGLHLLYSQNWRIPKLSTQGNKPSYNFVQQFLDNCTSYEADATTYADRLYDVYFHYCNLIQAGTPLTKIVFTKEVRKLHRYEYKKPRHSRTDNRYAFIGMKIDEKKSMNFLERLDKEQPKAFPADFTHTLSEPLEIVHTTIQSLLDRLDS